MDNQSVAEVPVEALLDVAHGDGVDPRVLVLDICHGQVEARDLVARGIPQDRNAIFMPAHLGQIIRHLISLTFNYFHYIIVVAKNTELGIPNAFPFMKISGNQVLFEFSTLFS